MKTSRVTAFGLLLFVAVLAFGGEWHWNSTGPVPSLSLNLGDGTIHQNYRVNSTCDKLRLTLRGDGLEQDRVELSWISDGQAWMSQIRRLPDRPVAWMISLPPGRDVQLRISPVGRDPVAIVRLLRK